jgi:hypothetical protein
MSTPKHLCRTCKLANWKKTVSGRRHPSGNGRCEWKQPHIPTPAMWMWDCRRGASNQPITIWGMIDWRTDSPVLKCEIYEEAKP